MRRRFGSLRASLLLAVGCAGGCGVLFPLGEFDAGESASAGTSQGGTGLSEGAGEGGQLGPAGGEDSVGGRSAGTAGTVGAAGVPVSGDAGSAGDSGCVSNSECIERGATGAPYRCSTEGRCIALRTGTCPLVYDEDDAKHKNPLYIGAFASLPPTEPEKSTTAYPFFLALDELSGDAYGGLRMPNGERRPLVLVVCDNRPESIDEGAAHLVEEVGVSAVLATLLPGDLRRVFERYQDDDVFFLSPVGATSAVVTLDDADRVWTMLGQPKDLAPVYRDLVEKLVEPYLRDMRGIGSRAIKVAVLRGADAFGLELSDLVVKALHWNGESAVTNEDNGYYRGFKFDGSLTPQDAVDDLLNFVPDLVISTAGEEVTRQTTGVVHLLETQWDGVVAANTPRPFYVLSPFNAGDLGPVMDRMREQLCCFEDSNRRFVGITAAGAENRTLQNDFAIGLADAFMDANVDTGNYYDAAYFLTYALYAAHRDAPRGKDIARGMRRLLQGESVNVGFGDISRVTELLKGETGTVELNGTLGPPAFDLETGVRVDAGAVYCFASSGTDITLYPEAIRYDRASATFTGDFPCFDGFAP